MRTLPLPLFTAVAIATASPLAAAQDPAPASAPAAAASEPAPASEPATASASLSGDGLKTSSSGGGEADDGTPWIKRHRPVRNQLELGIYGGILLPARDHELYDPSVAHQTYGRIAPDLGLRFGYYPLSFLGVEVEGGIAPTRTQTDGKGAVIGMFRGYGIVQLPYRVAPFAVIGYGLMSTSGLGKDVDPALHFGGGVKLYLTRMLALRLDVRDNLAPQKGVTGGRTHHVEALLGLSLVLGRGQPRPGHVDSDRDGFVDGQDACPTTPGVAPDGCPADTLARDSDGDGFLGVQDRCPDEPGVAPDGCPEQDSDGDGFVDSKDQCPDTPGVAPDGCPPPDTDKDGILDRDDKCIPVPETRNGYQDADGCPDEVPKAVLQFTGVIQGIYFDVDKDTIKKRSRKTLEGAVKVLKDFPDVRVEVSGHTNNTGDREHNLDLSRRRAEAVKKYLVDKGINDTQISTRGVGPDEPIADNKTRSGKGKNRRIEFKLQ